MGNFGGASTSNFESRVGRGTTGGAPLNQSIGATSQGGDNQTTGATNQDLNRRLAEMKAKLQALKKK